MAVQDVHAIHKRLGKGEDQLTGSDNGELTSSSVASQIREWAATKDEITHWLGLDREGADTSAAIRAALAAPASIEEVERIERLARALWQDALTPGTNVGAHDARQCARFFSQIGFFYKYKPYGLKLATPLGYSLFDLHNDQGFSFQIHVKPKLEAIHILAPKTRSLIYLSSLAEWNCLGRRWAQAYMDGKPVLDPPPIWRPAAGDTVSILETEIVHTVLGCILEEYAGCSVDAVERLFDPYPRADFHLPSRHQSVSNLFGLDVRWQRRLSRTPTGWDATFIDEFASIIDVPGDLWGRRLRLDASARWILPSSDELATTAIAITGSTAAYIEGEPVILQPGEYLCVPPRTHTVFTAIKESSTLALHRVARRLVQADWTS